MTTPNVFPADLLQEIRDLKAAVQQLQTAVAKRSPLVEASAGWVLRQMSTPSIPPSGDVHIYASGGRLRALSTLDDVPLTGTQFGSSVPNTPAPTSGTIGGGDPPTEAEYNRLRDDYIALRDSYHSLLAVLRAGRFPSP